VIRLPPGFSGAIDLAIELTLVDDTVVDRKSLHLDWPQKPTLEPISAGSKASVSAGAIALSQSIAEDQVAALDAIEGEGDHDPFALLIGRSKSFLIGKRHSQAE
jgi:hypothetical protein